MDASAKPLIGEILLKRRVISQSQLDEALELQKRTGAYLGKSLMQLGYLNEQDVVVALVIQCGLPYIAVNKYDISPSVINLLPRQVAMEQHVIPLDRIGDVLSLVMTHPLSEKTKKSLEQLTGCMIATFISTESEIDQAIARWYEKGS